MGGLPEKERKEVLTAFKDTLSIRFFVTEFQKHGWEARAIFPDALRFWQSRGTPLPSFEQFVTTQTPRTAEDMRARITELEQAIKE